MPPLISVTGATKARDEQEVAVVGMAKPEAKLTTHPGQPNPRQQANRRSHRDPGHAHPRSGAQSGDSSGESYRHRGILPPAGQHPGEHSESQQQSPSGRCGQRVPPCPGRCRQRRGTESAETQGWQRQGREPGYPDAPGRPHGEPHRHRGKTTEHGVEEANHPDPVAQHSHEDAANGEGTLQVVQSEGGEQVGSLGPLTAEQVLVGLIPHAKGAPPLQRQSKQRRRRDDQGHHAPFAHQTPPLPDHPPSFTEPGHVVALGHRRSHLLLADHRRTRGLHLHGAPRTPPRIGLYPRTSERRNPHRVIARQMVGQDMRSQPDIKGGISGQGYRAVTALPGTVPVPTGLTNCVAKNDMPQPNGI